MTKFVTPVPSSSINQSSNTSAASIAEAANPRVPVQLDWMALLNAKMLHEDRRKPDATPSTCYRSEVETYA
jgi:hypothetical protein